MNSDEHMSDEKEEALKIFKNLKEVGSQVLTLVNTLKDRVINGELGVENVIFVVLILLFIIMSSYLHHFSASCTF